LGIGYWGLAMGIGYWVLGIGYWVLVLGIGYWVLGIGYWTIIVHTSSHRHPIFQSPISNLQSPIL
jgi:hypothetical protein